MFVSSVNISLTLGVHKQVGDIMLSIFYIQSKVKANVVYSCINPKFMKVMFREKKQKLNFLQTCFQPGNN